MFLTSCARLAREERTWEPLLQKLDALLSQMGTEGAIVVADFAFHLDTDEDNLERVFGELLDRGGLRREARFNCRNGCYSFTEDEMTEAVAEEKRLRCPECNSAVAASSEFRSFVYFIAESVDEKPRRTIAVGRTLIPGATYKMVFASANPELKNPLALEQEWKQLHNRVTNKKASIQLEKVDLLAVTLPELRQAIISFRPTIVHFCGHGTHQQGLNLVGKDGNVDRIAGAAIANILELVPEAVDCVFLNACFSADQAHQIAPHAHCVVAFSGELDDEVAAEFMATFYESLTAGLDYGTCFRAAAGTIDPRVLTPKDYPVIWIDGVEYK